jgi:hypothetical protein
MFNGVTDEADNHPLDWNLKFGGADSELAE